jgi:membrane dipeptidase
MMPAPPAAPDLPIVDGHLDLAENVTLFGRDLTQSVAEIRARENRTSRQATVSLPELRRGGVAVVCATVTAGFLASDVAEEVTSGAVPRSALYSTPEEAEAQALRQLALYEQWAREGRVRLLHSVTDLDDHLARWREDRLPGLVLLMEGADPIVRVADLPQWWRRGLRMIGITFGDTRYGRGARGSVPFAQGGLNAAGLALLEAMAEQGFIWDISHLTDDGIRQGLDYHFPHVCASHANARALTPTDRHLPDDVIQALGARGGVIGLVLYNGFLEPRWREDRSLPVTLAEQLRRQAEHVAAVAGWEHVGIGSDLDGGLGLEETPVEIESVADLARVGDVVPAAARAGVLGGNWLAFLRRSLPPRST